MSDSRHLPKPRSLQLLQSQNPLGNGDGYDLPRVHKDETVVGLGKDWIWPRQFRDFQRAQGKIKGIR